MAVIGQEVATGDFEVEDVCFAGLGPQPPLGENRKGKRAVLVSGLNLDASAKVRACFKG